MIEWVAGGTVVVTAILCIADIIKNRQENAHEYRMARLEYDEKALGEAGEPAPDPPGDDPAANGAGEYDPSDDRTVMGFTIKCFACFKTLGEDDATTAVVDTGHGQVAVPVCDRRRCRRRAKSLDPDVIDEAHLRSVV